MSFYSDYEKKKNKNKTSALLKVPQVVPQKPAKQDNSRRATAAHNREQQRVQAHQNAQRPASTYLTGGSTTRSQPYAANQQRNTVFQQRGNTRQGLSGTGSRNTQQNNVRQPASTYLTGGSVTRSQPYAASQQNQLFSARKAAEQRRNPRQNVSTATKSSGDGNLPLTQFLKNSMDWHTTSDPNRKAQLHAQNDALRRKLGYEYNPQTGASFDKFGHEMTAGVRMAYGSTPTERLNQATKLLHTSGIMGKTDKATVYPTAMQAAQGLDEDYFSGQTGYNAHKTMHDLFNRSDETWSSEDTQSRDRARQELSDEMSRIMKRYGLDYQPRDNADDIMNRLKAAGADENTLAYVQENIDLRHAADRLGNSMEAVGKRWIASLPSLVDTSRQASANVEESRQNEEYRQLEEREQQLELQLQGIPSTDADGRVSTEFQAVYDQLQAVKERKNELTVNKGVDPNKWSQRMLREANEAQANAEAGLAPAPRWLTEQGISLAGNAPVMAASAIPVVGPAVGSIMMGGQAAGQRSFELNEQGKGARESLTRGLTSGAIEAATERLPLGQMSKILHSDGVNAVKNILIQMGEEATEESASYFLNYVADLAANDPDAKFSLAELTQSAAGGAFGGLVFGTAGAVGSRAATDTERMNAADAYDYNQVQQLVQLDSELQAALKLPEGPIRERAVHAAQNKMADKISGLMTQQAAQNAELTANYDADLNNRMSLAQRAQAAEYLNQRTGQVDAWQDGQTKPRLGTETEQRAESSYRTPEEEYALQSQLAKHFAEEQQAETGGVYDKATVQQADAAQHRTLNEVISSNHDTIAQTGVLAVLKDEEFAGSKKKLVDRVTDFFNSIGNKVFRAGFGDVTLTRSGARDSISHGMGRNKAIAFSAVPEVIENGAIIDTQSNWKGRRYDTVTFGGQVQIGEQVYDMGVIVKKYDNADMASKYYLHEVVLTNEKGETMSFMTGTEMGYPSDTVSPDGSDIPSVDNSIRQNVGNSNTSDTNIPLSEAMQYGRTPEQAVMEARAKAEGERVLQVRETRETAAMQSRLDDIWQELIDLDARGQRQSDAFRELWNKKEQLKEQLAARGVETGPVMPNIDQSASLYDSPSEEMSQEAKTQERLDRITNGKNRDIMQRVYEAQERAERVASRHALERATTRATASDADSYIDHTQEDIAIDLVNSLESERRFLTNLRNGWHLSDAELVNAERMAAGRGPVTEMDSHRYELVETYARAMRQYNEDMQPYYAFQRGLDDARLRRATELIKDSDNWKDSRGNLGLQIHTPERVLRKVMGDTAETEAIYQAYFAPVLKHDAEAIRWENTQRERLKDIMEGLSHEDSVYMHMKNRAELSPKNEAMQKQLADYVKENKSKIHFKQAESAMQKLYEMTSEMHPQVSEAGVRNGYAPLEFRQKYIPSLTPTKEGKWYNRILRKVGVETMVDELPTEIAGRTEDRRPGRQYAGFYNQREGINTEFDAFKAMDNYISGASNAIFHTDDIQNLRVLEDAIRSKYSDEGSRAELEAIRKDPDINIEDKEQKISKIWERNSGTLPSFPSWIAEYTNILAGKKSRTDRSAEQMFGRGLYRAMSDVEGKVAANMVGGNLSTAISNFIPLAQGSGEVRYSSMMRAMLDYGADLAKKNPAFHEDSDFLTNRRGSERIIKTKLQKASDAAGWTMNAIDNLSSEVMVRARYLDNVEKRHMSTEAALQEADRWAAGLIGDRARGAKPVIMESKSPLIKAFTMFQLEVMNQYDHLFGDIPHYLRAQGKSKAQIAAGTAAALLQVFVMSHLFNDAREKLTGSRGAFDPIEMVNDFVGRLTGYALPNIFDLLGEMMGDGIDEDDFHAEKSETAWDNVTATAQDIASNIPFVSGPLGSLAGAGNSRLPIQSVIPSIANIATAQGEDARSMAMIKELSKPLHGFLLPFGGLQAKKTVEGAATMFAGGSYSYDKKGEKILQFPTYGQKPADWAQALLFGKSSSDEARAWRESGYETLNAEETKAFDELRKRIKTWKENDNSEAVYAAIKAMRAITDEAREKYPDGYTDVAAGQKREMLFNDNDLNEMQKNYLDRELIGSAVGSSGDYSSRDMFDISQKVREARQDDAMEALKHGISVDEFANWDAIIEQTLTDNEVDAEDFVEGENNELYKKNEALYAILNEYANSGEHTDAEKNAFADYLLVSAMEDSDRERWDAVKGTVSATDFVKFASDMTTYNKEYKGSGLSKSDAMQSILDGYKNLSDTQKDALFGVYSDSASGNAFHISKYEEAIKDNSFYSYLKDAGKKELRSLLNSYEKHVADNAKLDDWEAKAAVAKEAGISPGIYALFQVALQEADTDGKGLSQAKAKAAVESVGGLTQAQKAYLWQSADKSWKKNPYGSATVSEYKYAGGEFANPVAGGTISSKFGPRDTFSTSNGASSSRWHKSIDIAAPAGTAIKSVQGGKVTANGWVSGYGWTIEVTHDNGYVSMYHHMQNQSSVAVGTEVKQGQTIGNVGSTGNSTGPHLDLTITKDGTPVDPASLIGDYKNAKTGYVYEGSPVYTQLSSAASKSKKSSGGSRRSSGGSSSGGLKQLKGLSGLKGLGF